MDIYLTIVRLLQHHQLVSKLRQRIFLHVHGGAGTVTWLNTEVESANMIDPVAYKDMNAKK